MFIRISLIVLFFVAVFTAPWWYATALAIAIGAYGKDLIFLPLGGVSLDLLFGTPIVSLLGFSFLYTAIFSLIALIAFFVHRHMFE